MAFRTDGSSRLAKGNQWAVFPSGGASWSIKDEHFMQDINWINNLKLRVSYGTVGNTAISPYQTLQLCLSRLICLEKIHLISSMYIAQLRL